MKTLPPLRFTLAELYAASGSWGMNCGPGALCAIANLTPDEVRPHLGGFEQKGYTNPTLMFAALRSLNLTWIYKAERIGSGDPPLTFPRFGLARIQWGGPWTKPGVPIAARYRKTHWVGSCLLEQYGIAIFDVNLVAMGGWIDLKQWSEKFVPDLLKECEPKANGEWWITHSIEVTR